MASSSTLLFSVLVGLLAVAIANDIEIDNYQGTYEFERGVEDGDDPCPRMVTFDSAGENLNITDLSIEDNQCEGPEEEIVFRANDGTPNDRFIQFLSGGKSDGEDSDGEDSDSEDSDSEERDATWVTANTAVDYQCGNINVSSATLITIFNFDGDDDNKLDFEDIYGDQVPISEGGEFEVEEDQAYLILRETGRCLYKRSGGGDDDDDSVCFPASAKVTLESGKQIRMDQVQLGDRVLVADGTYSDVFMFTHADASSTSRAFVRLFASDKTSITLTASHYIYANDLLVPAKQVKKGDTLKKSDGSKVQVVKVQSSVMETGLYNPQTLHGDISVNGFIASTYTITVQPKLAHSLLTPFRAIYSLFAKAPLVAGSEL